MNKIPPEDLTIESAIQVDENLLSEYYKKVYPHKSLWLIDSWKWLYRTSYSGEFPLVLIHNGAIIGHFGAIPFDANLKGSHVKAAWFVDFSLLPEYRGQRIGPILTRALMDRVQVAVTHCNEHSIKVFERLGWERSDDSYFYFVFIRPFSYSKIRKFIPAFVGKILDYPILALQKVLLRSKSSQKQSVEIEVLNSNNLNSISFDRTIGTKPFCTSHTEEYLKWRFLDSKLADKYYLFNCVNTGNKAILKLIDRDNRYVEVLHIDADKGEFLSFIKMIRKWALKNNYVYLKIFTSLPEVADLLNGQFLSILRKPIYAYHSNSNGIMEKLKSSSHEWQLADSDLEDQ